jgi:hypothetical protein
VRPVRLSRLGGSILNGRGRRPLLQAATRKRQRLWAEVPRRTSAQTEPLAPAALLGQALRRPLT